MSYQGYKELLVQKADKILVVKFNKPAKKNAINSSAYKELMRVFTDVNEDKDVTIVVITGVGEYFTAGNDLSQGSDIEDIEAYQIEASKNFKGMVNGLINCTKLIFSLVNGPAIGIGATLAAMSDVVWCAEEAYFLTPFSKLGLVPECCSSVTFPAILGRSKATEMLVLNEKLSAQEAYHFHLVSRIFKLSELDTAIWPKIREYSKLPPNAMQICKGLIQTPLRDTLVRANDAECEKLAGIYNSDEFIEALISFASRKSKL